MICHVTNMCYIKLAANSCQIFIMLNLQPETTQWKVAPPPPPSPPPKPREYYRFSVRAQCFILQGQAAFLCFD